MKEKIQELRRLAAQEIESAADLKALEQVRIRHLGRKGRINDLFGELGAVPSDERGSIGKLINQAKQEIADAIEAARVHLTERGKPSDSAVGTIDISIPGTKVEPGSLNPITLMQHRLEDIFSSMGFHVLDYPDVESDYYNFEALNIPKDHPARDMQDTLWLENGSLLRTHTSAGQVRAMETFKPPFRAIFPGRCFRHEAQDSSHEHTFYQVEGLMIDRDISVANLISVMQVPLNEVFEREMTTRLRPGYFPFVEPGFELDVKCVICDGEGCSVCKRSGWVELIPCGLVHPNVLRFGGVDPEKWSGFAFGLGLSRLVMMKYRIDEIRLFMRGDVRFLRQF